MPRVSVCSSLTSVEAKDWDALVAPDDPFTEHAFLLALETSGCVGEDTGWLPRHLLAHQEGVLVGALPCYLKSHSFGEYIFDWAWAEGAQNAGLPYYPKLCCAVPFTPVTGRRLLLTPDEIPEFKAHTERAVVAGLMELAKQEEASSAHLLFCTEEERAALSELGFLARSSSQYHWQRDPSWGCFDDFLASLRSSSRKQIRRERRRANSHGLCLEMVEAAALSDEDLEAVYRCYQDTGARKWGQPYLNRAFFEALQTSLAPRARVALAREEGTLVAASLFFERGDALYGRYWGSLKAYDCLHFELCYYLPIAYALERGLNRFEAGAQGEHKIRRGLMPVETYSAHFFAHPGLGGAVAHFVVDEAEVLENERRLLAAHGPFRRGPL